ncbi:NB-ARC domain-containing protein [Paenibacillus sp. OK060]|uniref:tetratricopeptide repeat protein n=1 Tax=Paenibacillus sp. OK060 TaxID=1881034 RepID=UPI000889F7F9|nr:tetratricopeptide repeat protein [Paenibacillus sp. OK060]SDM42343.1 NB-ARC domain-containing protein [Paenibacillus sp. OK060]
MDQLINNILSKNTTQTLIEPPVETKIQQLPFSELTWENFEKLCLKLILTDSKIIHSQSYGERGQEQSGIDIYAQEESYTTYKVFQCKKVKNFGPEKVKEAVAKFLKNEWVNKTNTFVLCTSESMISKGRADEIESQRVILRNYNIELEIWDSNKLSQKLKGNPTLVEDFFGMQWVEAFCVRDYQELNSYNTNKKSTKIINHRFLIAQNFFGRSNELQSIRTKLQESRNVFITGMPGIGKTQLAVQYLTTYKDDYQTICWVRSESAGLMYEDLYLFMKEVMENINRLDNINNDSILGYLRNWMEQNQGYLFIFDNLKSQSELRFLLPSMKSGHVLVTSQDKLVENEKSHLELEPLLEDDSIELLLQTSGREKDMYAIKITEYFGNLPLSIMHSGSFVRHSKKTFQQVYQLLLERPIDVKKRIGSVYSTDKSFENLINIILDELVSIQPKSLDFMILLSFLSSDYISLEWFDKQTEVTELVSLFEDELLYYDVRVALLGYSFINEHVQTNALSIHRLLQSTIRERLTLEEKKNWYRQMTRLFKRLIQEGGSNPIEYRKKADLVKHIEVLALHYEDNMKDVDFLELLNITSNYLTEIARYPESFALNEFIWAKYMLLPEIDEISKACVLSNMGMALKHQNKYLEASLYYNQALSILEQQNLTSSLEYAICLMNSGRLDMDLGKLEESYDKLSRSLELVEHLNPKDNTKKFHFLNNFGLILEKMNKKGAYKYYFKALNILKLSGQLDTTKAGALYNNLSVVLMKRKKTKWAILSLHKSLNIDKKFLGEKHPVLAYRYQNLADAYSVNGFHHKAIENYKIAYKIRRKYFDLDHPDIGILFLKYGRVLVERKKYEEGKQWIFRSLRIDEVFFKDHFHPELETALETLAYIQIITVVKLLDQNNRDIEYIKKMCKEGEKYITRALKIKYSEEKIARLEDFKIILKEIRKGRI